VKRYKEAVAFLLLLILRLAPRLAFVTRFPTIPASDFYALVAFGQSIRDHRLATNVPDMPAPGVRFEEWQGQRKSDGDFQNGQRNICPLAPFCHSRRLTLWLDMRYITHDGSA
jgi:hypothetical protein